MEKHHKSMALFLCFFIGLFFILDIGTTADQTQTGEEQISLQSVQMVFRSSAARTAGRTQVQSKLLFAVTALLPVYLLLNAEEGSGTAALRWELILVPFLLYTLRIIYRTDGKKRKISFAW